MKWSRAQSFPLLTDISTNLVYGVWDRLVKDNRTNLFFSFFPQLCKISKQLIVGHSENRCCLKRKKVENAPGFAVIFDHFFSFFLSPNSRLFFLCTIACKVHRGFHVLCFSREKKNSNESVNSFYLHLSQ